MKKLEKRFTKNPNTVEAYICACNCTCSCDAYCSAQWKDQQTVNYLRDSKDRMISKRELPYY